MTILETDTGETVVRTSIESIDVLLTVGAEEISQGRLRSERSDEPREKHSVEYTCYYTLPAKNNILEELG